MGGLEMNPNKMQQRGNLGARRQRRAEARQAEREARGEKLPLFFVEGRVFAELPAEFPIRVLAPLRELKIDIALMLRQLLVAVKMLDGDDSDEPVARMAVVDFVIDTLMANPGLLGDLLGTVQEMARRLFGDDGYAMFLEDLESLDDVKDTVAAIFEWYGPALGKLLSSSVSSTDGTTSKETSSTTTTSTPESSSQTPASPDGSGSDAS